MQKLNIVIPTINRKDLLMEALVPLNIQQEYFEKLLIIDNGNQGIENDISGMDLVKNNKVQIIIPEQNLGVSASWNLGIDQFKSSDFILFLNDDVVIGNTQLKDVHEKLLDVKPFWLATGNCLWSMFTMSRECWSYFLETEGHVFDSNFFPAYFEDNDMHYRLVLALNKLYGNVERHVGSAEMNPALFRNSMTIKKDSKINSGFGKNQKYFIKKWGGTPGHEKFTRPFNK